LLAALDDAVTAELVDLDRLDLAEPYDEPDDDDLLDDTEAGDT